MNEKIEFPNLCAVDIQVEDGTVSFAKQAVAVKVGGHQPVFFRNAAGAMKGVSSLDEVRKMASSSAERLLAALKA